MTECMWKNTPENVKKIAVKSSYWGTVVVTNMITLSQLMARLDFIKGRQSPGTCQASLPSSQWISKSLKFCCIRLSFQINKPKFKEGLPQKPNCESLLGFIDSQIQINSSNKCTYFWMGVGGVLNATNILLRFFNF